MIKIMFALIILIKISFADHIGMVKNFYGDVKVKRSNKLLPVNKGFRLQDNDLIITDSKSGVGLIFKDGSTLSLGERSIFSIKRYLFSPKDKKFDIDLKLKKGKAAFSSGKIGKLSPESLKFEVSQGIIGIRGTKFLVEVKGR